MTERAHEASLARVERQIDPPESRRQGKRHPHDGLYLVMAWTFRCPPHIDTRESVEVIPLAAKDKGGLAALETERTYYGEPGLPWKEAQALKREMRRGE